MSLAKNSELLETDMEQMRKDLLEEKRHKRKLEKILADCAKAIKTALTVRILFFPPFFRFLCTFVILSFSFFTFISFIIVYFFFVYTRLRVTTLIF